MPEDSPPTILLYDSRGAADFLGPADRKLVTVEMDRLPDVRAVVFHVPSAPDIRLIPKREGQIWVAWSMESDAWYPQLSSVDYMKHFDLTMTYRLDSDFPVYISELARPRPFCVRRCRRRRALSQSSWPPAHRTEAAGSTWSAN